jgi:hypothetical protein
MNAGLLPFFVFVTSAHRPEGDCVPDPPDDGSILAIELRPSNPAF